MDDFDEFDAEQSDVVIEDSAKPADQADYGERDPEADNLPHDDE